MESVRRPTDLTNCQIRQSNVLGSSRDLDKTGKDFNHAAWDYTIFDVALKTPPFNSPLKGGLRTPIMATIPMGLGTEVAGLNEPIPPLKGARGMSL